MEIQRIDDLNNALISINENIEVDKIYLFGSYAKNEQNEESDLDICIITNHLAGRKIDVLRKIRRSFVNKITMPIDLLLYTTDEFGERAKLSSTFEYKIANEGVLVHGS